jgi:hypothetical protein
LSGFCHLGPPGGAGHGAILACHGNGGCRFGEIGRPVPRAPPRWDGWPLCFTSHIAAPSPGFTGLRVSSPNPGFRKQLATRRSCSVHTELVVGTPSSLCCNFLVTGSDCSQRPRARLHGAQCRLYRRAFILRSGHRWDQLGQRRLRRELRHSWLVAQGPRTWSRAGPLFFPSGARGLFVKANNGG